MPFFRHDHHASIERHLIDKRCPAFFPASSRIDSPTASHEKKSATPGKSGGGVWHVRGQGKGGRA